jgi:hypothetical protein
MHQNGFQLLGANPYSEAIAGQMEFRGWLFNLHKGRAVNLPL